MATTSEIESVLREHAIDSQTDIGSAWEIKSSEYGLRFVEAATRETYPNPTEACAEGLDLMDRLTDPLGFVLQGYCTIGADRLCGPDAHQSGWRGLIKVGLREDTPEALARLQS